MVQTDDKTLDQLNEEADIAADYLEGLLDIADYEGDIEMGVRNGRPMVQIVADDDTDISPLNAVTLALHGAMTTRRDPTQETETWF